MKFIINLVPILAILFICSCAVLNIPLEERVSVQYYISQADYKNNKLKDNAYTSIKKKGKDYISIEKIFGSDDKKIEKAKTAFAIIIDNELYFNMRNSVEYNNSELYAKFNIIGTISALFINDRTSSTIKNGGTNYGFGVAGVILSDADKWGKNWKDTKDQKHKIMIFNKDKVIDYKIRYINIKYELLSQKNFNDLLGTQLSESEIDNLTFEDVKEIIIDLNKKAK
ncbi:MAG TPA: hypothetical protein PJ990_15620 [Saprospiraceae bacterium]|nr:hypothetical protein [Saprospiraceae bacterium]